VGCESTAEQNLRDARALARARGLKSSKRRKQHTARPGPRGVCPGEQGVAATPGNWLVEFRPSACAAI